MTAYLDYSSLSKALLCLVESGKIIVIGKPDCLLDECRPLVPRSGLLLLQGDSGSDDVIPALAIIDFIKNVTLMNNPSDGVSH